MRFQASLSTMRLTWSSAAIAGAVLAAAIAFPFIRKDYQIFLRGGPSYAPQNLRGYIIVLVLALFRGEEKGLAIYEQLPEKRAWLPELPKRNGDRPKTTSHIIQRQASTALPSYAPPLTLAQLNQYPDPEFVDKSLKGMVIPRVQARHESTTQLALSKFEFHATAIFVLPDMPIDNPKHIPSHDTVRRTKREVAHMHDYHDCTLHLALAAQDGRQVLEKGWGQRHPLAGPGMPGPPTEWTFIYAPRDEEEVKVVETIVEASIAYMTNAEKPVKLVE
ncbi:hypothetical protein MKEN_01106900 [Mycena kentingensis (nom. inval.)]|nr:hypothetical protein MKEN_01106900 [Mycena kentingensis (nom. inval.)]